MNKHTLPAALFAISVVTTTLALVQWNALAASAVPTDSLEASPVATEIENPFAGRLLPAAFTKTKTNTVAERLQKRIVKRFGFTPSIGELERDIARQRELFAQSVDVTFAPDDGALIPALHVAGDQFPSISVTPSGVRTSVDPAGVMTLLASLPSDLIRTPSDTVILSTAPEDEIIRAQTEGVAKIGYDYDPNATTRYVIDAFDEKVSAITVPLTTVAGTVVNATGQDFGKLELLGVGRSNFEGSGEGRKANVRKGLNKYLNNVVVPAGEEFSINAILKHVPIREWEMALGIFNGGELRPVAGGGLCQVATTLFRGILHSGLPVTQRANHSLFVHYYEKYGVGIDATIFPAGGPDLRFRNDTGHTIFIQAYSDGDEATVALYGTPDGRSVTMTGPYFTANAPEGYQVDGKPLSKSQIAWERTVTYPDGRTEGYTLLSKYKSIPSSVVKEYAGTLATISSTLHAAAQNSTAEVR